MALDFPSGAGVGAVYTGTNGTTYTYDGIRWNGQVAAPAVSGLTNGDQTLTIAKTTNVTGLVFYNSNTNGF